jgi:salicylaldehyde dehydrogenase
MSTERLVVDAAVADEFVSKYAARAQELPAGDPATTAGCVIGPMVSNENGARLRERRRDAGHHPGPCHSGDAHLR